MNAPDIEPTAEALDAMADRMRDNADQLTRIAAQVRATSELSQVREALNCVANLMPNLHMDLLIQRPLSALGVK